MFGRNRDMIEVRVGDISIRVRPLDLGIDFNQLLAERQRAEQEKNADDVRAYSKSTAELKTMAEDADYFGSMAHNAWATAAAVRSGSVLPLSWWKDFDPFGGTAGNGPDVLPQGQYPGLLSRIAMGHDTDWSLGRYFGAGPMAKLRGSNMPPWVLGAVGLTGEANLAVGMDTGVNYTFGHEDWIVRFN